MPTDALRADAHRLAIWLLAWINVFPRPAEARYETPRLIRKPTMLITTSNSMRVKPRLRRKAVYSPATLKLVMSSRVGSPGSSSSPFAPSEMSW